MNNNMYTQVKDFAFQSRSHALEQAVNHLKKEMEKEKEIRVSELEGKIE